MKQYKFLSTALFLAAMVAWSGCSNEDESLPVMSGTEGLVINVCDKGMENAESSASRAVTDLNYNTTFEIGDCIGLFAVKDNAILSDVNNLKVQLTREGWQPAADLQYDGALREATYYAYFPYRENLSINSVETDFFASAVAGWNIGKDQSTRKDFADSDLMTSSGSTIYRGDKGEFLIQLDMSHRMSLVVISLPGTEYKFTNPELRGTTYAVKPTGDVEFYRGAIGSSNVIKPYRAEDGTYRMLVRPVESPDIIGVLGNTKYEIKKSVDAGKYKRFLVDRGSRVIDYELKVGDYYCADGNLVSRDAEEVPDDCIGIVYYVGNPQPSVLYKDDEAVGETNEKDCLRRDYSNCIHGLVYAVKCANSKAARFASITSCDYTAIFNANSAMNTAYLWGQAKYNYDWVYHLILGYNNTEVLKMLHESGESGADEMLTKYLEPYIEQVPSPVVSTKWYLPSLEELSIISENKEVINASLEHLEEGEPLWNVVGGNYWTSTCRAKGTMWLACDNGEFVATTLDTKKSGYFRFSLAF